MPDFSYSITPSNPLKFYVPSSTTIVFTKAINVSGKVQTSGTSLDILGTTKINAIEFTTKGTLVISTNSKIGYCDLIAFNFSTKDCKRTVISTGAYTYGFNISKTNKTYCMLYISDSSVIKANLNIEHSSISPDGKSLTLSSPSITSFHSKSKNKKMIIFTIGKSYYGSDLLIDGNKSYYSFYNISDSTSSKININSPAGFICDPNINVTDGDGKSNVSVVWIIIVALIILGGDICIILICMLFLRKKRSNYKSMELQSSLLNTNQYPNRHQTGPEGIYIPPTQP
ncbi:hypothetical protein TVAG_043780 [Trichomonas vaginalis G3]|uniref:Uncharacterized protein n=1 Tax=Trichomonas vaginalis (strain ATCC PRA-98 / G3) TaxID=412133 RepID=A2EVB8_TRIV3|nr:hypothetical protein TVAGG3_0826110 [Trichomonas vaginalis G3]EAY03432.1 hypothetical protein TVAG_043780 [Trichomonas vaginalis G3]KAI5498249.1 hypothetical protein TVAGG3_0826110 [Trichomonas vaginalis G3]|eukprot:XP_001315655.1 hypothetical protein [Trichomonas vaginalis G3]